MSRIFDGKLVCELFLKVYFIYIAFEAAIRYLFFEINLPFMVYMIKILMLILMLFNIKRFMGCEQRVFYVFIFSSILTGLYYLGIERVAIAFLIFIPLIFFLHFDALNYISNISTRFLFICLVLSSAGVCIDSYINFPWEGYLAQLGNYEIQVNRLWWTDGVERLSGFGRSSFETATYVSVIFTLLLGKINNKINATAIFGFCFYIIYMTTTKGAMLAIIASYLFYIIPSMWLRIKIFYIYAIIIIGNVILIIPLFDLKFEWLINNFNSLYERIAYMWPYSINIINDTSIMFGTGLGGVGVSLAKTGSMWAAVDNYWLYLYATFGLVGYLIYLCSLLIAIPNLVFSKYIVTYVFLFVYGFTTNVIESAFGQLVFAMLFVDIFSRFFHKEKLHNEKSSLVHGT
jgi:hypothetical protein